MKIFSDLPRNAKSCAAVEPMWSVFGGMILFYVPLYMKDIGLTEVEMGIVNTLNMLIAFGCHFFAGPITNRLGRKRTTLVFDVISWTIPMFIWAIAQNFWFFVVAAIINAFVKVVNVSWSCLITEDTPRNKRSKVFGLIYLMNYATGIFTPITGFFIARFGTITTMRLVYAIGMVCMTSMFFLRNSMVTETAAGREMMNRYEGLSLGDSIKRYINVIITVSRNKSIIMIAVIFIISNFVLSMNFFQSLYLKEYRGFNTITMSITQGVNAFTNVILYLFVIPKLVRHAEEKILAAAIAVNIIGAILFLLIPENNIPILLIATATLGVGSFSTQAYRDSVFMNKLGEHEKADMYGAVQTVTALISIPAGYIAGMAYSFSPKAPFVMIVFLFAISFSAAMVLAIKCKKSA